MTQEQIKRAANSYIDDFLYNHIDYTVIHDNYETGKNNAICEFGPDIFKAGAQWRINSVWHTTADKPDFMRQCLLYLRDPMREGWHIGRVEKQGTNKGKWNIYGYFTPALHKYVARWAYIEDLLPADSK